MHKELVAAKARDHDGMYLLRRRYPKLTGFKDELDLEYDACQELVFENRARWISGKYAPGIRLTQ